MTLPEYNRRKDIVLAIFEEAEEITPDKWERIQSVLAKYPRVTRGISTENHESWVRRLTPDLRSAEEEDKGAKG